MNIAVLDDRYAGRSEPALRSSRKRLRGAYAAPYMTLARARELLDAMPMFLSCHRSLLANMDCIPICFS